MHGFPPLVCLLASLTVASCLCPGGAFHSATIDEPPGQAAAAAAQTAARSDEETAELKQRRKVFERVRALRLRLQSLPDDATKIFALIDVAGVLCKYDRAAGKELFRTASDTLLRWERAPERDLFDREQFSKNIRDQLVRGASACDAQLGKELNPNDPPPEAAVQAQSLLYRAMSKDAPAAALTNKALQVGGSEMWSWRPPDTGRPYVIGPAFFLPYALKAAGPAGGELFSASLSHVWATPSADIQNVLLLGGYVFDPRQSYFQGVLQPVWALDHVAHPELAPAYLNVVVDVLQRNAPDAQDRRQTLAAARGILPLVQKFLPDRVEELHAILQSVSPPGEAPPAGISTEAMNHSRTIDTRTVPAEAPVDASSADDECDAGYFRTAFELVEKHQLARARQAGARIRDGEVRGALMRYVEVKEGNAALDAEDVDGAIKIASRMPPSAERAALWVGIAAVRVKKDKQLAAQAAMTALNELASVSDGREGYIRVAIAQVLASIDTRVAFDVFAQGITGINQQYAARVANPHYFPPGFGYSFRVGREEQMSEGCHFDVGGSPLVHIKNFENLGELGDAVGRLAASDIERTESLCSGLAGPDDVANAIGPLVAAWLKKLPEPLPAKKQPSN